MLNIFPGSEDDDNLFYSLVDAVKGIGGSIVDTEWILGKSQELTRYSITLPARNSEALAETYIGLTLCGNPNLVKLLAGRVVSNVLSLSTK